MSTSNAVTKTDLQNILNEVLPFGWTDHIVAEGTDANGWTYRKWNSGKAECWGHFPFTSVSQAGTISPFLYNTITSAPNFPFTFTAAPVVAVCEFKWGSGLCLANVSGISTTKVTALQIFTTAIGDESGFYGLYAIGEWK